jgi:hypothetical protein
MVLHHKGLRRRYDRTEATQLPLLLLAVSLITLHRRRHTTG